MIGWNVPVTIARLADTVAHVKLPEALRNDQKLAPDLDRRNFGRLLRSK